MRKDFLGRSDYSQYDYGDFNSPHVGVQWKGTDVCLDLHCSCGNSSHYDGYNAYSIQCVHCGMRYDMAYSLELKPFTSTFEPVVTDA